MRKWIVIVITLLVATAAGVSVFVLRQDSVEELKKKYVAACSEEGWMQRLRCKWSRLTGSRINAKAAQERSLRRIEKCERALIKAGYLEERRFAVANLPATKVMHASRNAWFEKFQTEVIRERVLGANSCILFADTGGVIASLRTDGTQAVVIVAPREDMPKWEKIVRWEDAR